MRVTLLACLVLAACAHSPLAPSALKETHAVAIIARIEDDAGPRSTVFRDDPSYRAQLQPRHIDDKEADRRLTAVLTSGTFEKDKDGRHLKATTLTRFALADSLRSHLLSSLPRAHPWNRSLSPSAVARAFESFLVQEVPANAPDYHRLTELGVDTVVEIVVESYGMRSDKGRAGLFLVGSARMFRINGPELYHRHFYSDDVDAGSPHLDPFAVAKNATLFADRMQPIILAIAAQVAADLNPDRRTDAPSGNVKDDVATPKKVAAPSADPGSEDPL